MLKEYDKVDCQDPQKPNFILRTYTIVQCKLKKDSDEYRLLLERATQLAKKVNPNAANNSALNRQDDRLLIDAFGGVLAEHGWLEHINSVFGNIANSTSFRGASSQIDIRLSNGELLEVRSSFPRNGVKFALCNLTYNFRNIGPYSNSVKPGEVQKHLYLGILFDTQKDKLLMDSEICFSLVGGSTWQMMVEIGHDVDLVPPDGIQEIRTVYKVVEFKDALDVEGVESCLVSLGYPKI